MIHMSYWYGFVMNMLSFITKSVMILLPPSQTVSGYTLGLLVAATVTDLHTSYCPNTHLHIYSTTHIYINTATKYHISDTYKIINICHEIVHSITNVYCYINYMFYFPP